LAYSCEDPSSDQKALLNVILVDAPATWDSVFVSILGVEVDVRVQAREASLETFFLEYKPGVKEIEVSALVAGEALLLARGELPVGNIEGIRMILGNDHSLWKNDRQYPLPLESADMEVIPLEFNQDLEFGVAYDVILDFDLERSINLISEDPFIFSLSPEVSAIPGIGSGEIEGRIQPTGLRPAVYAIVGSDSISTQTNSSGVFLFRLPEGTFDLYVDPKDSLYEGSILEDVPVLSNQQTEVGDIVLEPKEE